MTMASDKYLNKVILSSDVYAVCAQHSLTTEKQEIMGLLIGEVDEDQKISYISACVILHRIDKQPDRVEISPEQLCIASTHAEQLSQKLKKPMRIIGWYHSHPHITVWPSHVDLRTQAMYQKLDALFVGLIFAVYQSDSRDHKNQIQVTCFQAQENLNRSELERRPVKLVIRPSAFHQYNLEGVCNLSKILIQEEVDRHDTENNEVQDELNILHNDAIKTLAMVHIISKVTLPLCEDIEKRKDTVDQRIKELECLKRNLTVKSE